MSLKAEVYILRDAVLPNSWHLCNSFTEIAYENSEIFWL